MRIGIIGAGNMGTAFARQLAAAGHDVSITSRDIEDAKTVEAALGGRVRAVPQQELADRADILIAATPFPNQVEALLNSGSIEGKTVVEISNPMKEDMSGLAVGHTSSAAEEVARGARGAKVVKAFNTVFAEVLANRPARRGDARVQVFFAGDDESAKRKVETLIESIGFEPVDAGPLSNARLLEPLGMLNIYLGYVARLGTDIAPGVARVSPQQSRSSDDEVTLNSHGGVADRLDAEQRAG